VVAVEEKLVLHPPLPQSVGNEREQVVVVVEEEEEEEEGAMLLPQSVEETEQAVAAVEGAAEGAGATNNS